ncbi:hypothetical protein BGZ99_002483, partial [Dissophora globulifera]
MKKSSALAHKRLLQKERRQEKADQRRLQKENTFWEEAEAAVDDYEYQQMLKTVQAESLRMAAMNTPSSTAAKTRTRRLSLKTSRFDEYGPMEEQEEARLKECEKLDRRLKRLKHEIKENLRYKRRLAPYGHLSIRSGTYRRTTGKRLTEEERRAVLHCFEMCVQENQSRIVSTVAPIQRTAHYLGIATKTVKDVLSGINHKDQRGRYIRTSHAEIFEPYIRNLAEQWNMKGTPVTLKKLHKGLRIFWGDTHQIPSRETIRKLLHKMGV